MEQSEGNQHFGANSPCDLSHVVRLWHEAIRNGSELR
jgi:hypothetical protein